MYCAKPCQTETRRGLMHSRYDFMRLLLLWEAHTTKVGEETATKAVSLC